MRTLSIYHLHFKMKTANSFIVSFLTQQTIISKFIVSDRVLATQNNKQQQQQRKTSNLLQIEFQFYFCRILHIKPF